MNVVIIFLKLVNLIFPTSEIFQLLRKVLLNENIQINPIL